VLGATVSNIRAGKNGVRFDVEDKTGKRTEQVDKFVVAIGRRPHTQGLGLEKIGVQLNKGGFVEVDEHCHTSIPNAWAIGDVVRGPMLAHKASEEGIMVSERIAGQAGHVNYETIPLVIYTSPEIAWVGMTEQELRAANIPFNAGVFPFKSNGRAQGLGETDGLTKILAHRDTDRILGVHIIGPYASEMITEAVVAMEFSASAEDLARIVHAHPSLSEVMHEAALAVSERAIHS
jgi:dihydrolipoamide dehydrogenase